MGGGGGGNSYAVPPIDARDCYHCLYKIYHYKVSIEKGSTSYNDDGGHSKGDGDVEIRPIRKPPWDRSSSTDFFSTYVVSIKLIFISRIFAVAALTDRAGFLIACYNLKLVFNISPSYNTVHRSYLYVIPYHYYHIN